ncbi:MAG: hypothetical protein HY694_18425 [Deltaproteobacteria bacterium]|nr:hypothetical protein [Deltaproteobacteria bacterium]
MRELKSHYDKEPHGYPQKEKLMGSLGLEDIVVQRNVKYLEQKGLADPKWFSGSGFLVQITSEGIDFLETGQPSGLAILSPVTIQQEFHAPVGAVAGRDINVHFFY